MVFQRQDPMRPGGKRLRFADMRQLRGQLLLELFRRVRGEGRGFWPFLARRPFGPLRLPMVCRSVCRLDRPSKGAFGLRRPLIFGIAGRARRGEDRGVEIILAGDADEGKKRIARRRSERRP